MSTSYTHRRFRFHLSTAMLLMAAASALLFANVRIRWDGDAVAYRDWPWAYWTRVLEFGYDFETGFTRPNPYGMGSAPSGFKRFLEPQYTPLLSALGDVTVAISILIVIAFVSEGLIRRRSNQRQ